MKIPRAEASVLKRFAESLERDKKMIRAALGPMEEFRRAGILDPDSPLRREIDSIQQLASDYEAAFRLPEIGQASRLMEEMIRASSLTLTQGHATLAAQIQQAMDAMQAPWLKMGEPLQSAGGFARLYELGHALRTLPPFGEQLTKVLRTDLGDWQAKIDWPEPIFSDLAARTEFYVERGFNSALTDFPSPAFEEILERSDLGGEPPPLAGLYGAPTPLSDDEEEEQGFARTNDAHDQLQRLETQVRRFIDERMTDVFGPDWPRQRLPNGLFEQWEEKKARAEEGSGIERPIIAYADFTDYAIVICRRDNWRQVFQEFFGREGSVRESFQRLHPIRVGTMHARLITQDDELYLVAEVTRLMRVMSE